MEYITVGQYAEEEYIVNKSRFIGYCTPVKSAEDATAFIGEIKARHRDATHNVYAYCVRVPEYSRYSDDGEPQGTAGQPTLDVLKKNGVTDACIVVTRYFGGILLGAGGLVRAYSHTARLALDSAGIVKMGLCTVFGITADYKWYDRLTVLIAQCAGTVKSTHFGEKIRIVLTVSSKNAKDFQNRLSEMSFGELHADIEGELFDVFA